jgi:hypothetical protein
MRQEAARKLDRQLAFEAIWRNLLPVLLGGLVALGLIFWVTNTPVSHQIIDGRYLRWTVGQTDYGQSMPRIFIDLPDGSTIMAAGWADWRPPPAGSVIRVEEQSLRWYGKRYHLVR